MLLYLLCIFSCCVHVVPSAPEFPISVFVFQFRKLLVSIRRLFPFRIPMNLDTLSLAASPSACGCGLGPSPLRCSCSLSNCTAPSGCSRFLFFSHQRTLSACISKRTPHICNSNCYAINYLRRSFLNDLPLLACAVRRPHFQYSKGSFSFPIIDISLLLNHSPSEWFSACKSLNCFANSLHAV